MTLNADLAAAVVLPMPFQQAHDGDLADHRTALRDAEPLPLRGVHVARFAADEGFVDFDRAAASCRTTSRESPDASRCSMNHAVFWVTPRSRAIS